MLSTAVGAILAMGLQGSPEFAAFPVDALLAAIRAQSVHRDRVSWPEVEPEVRAQVDAATTNAERANAIVALFARMGDVHSQLVYRGQTYAHYEGMDDAVRARLLPLLERERAQQGKAVTQVIDGHIGYVLVPGFQIGLDRVEVVGAALRRQVEELAEKQLDGWIIDLRLNGGGNLYPMLLGLYPILGDGVVGGTTDASGRVVQRWVLKPDGLFWRDEMGDRRIASGAAPKAPVDPAVPVAVLVGPLTISSGEALALAFRGRLHTALIGEPTARGYTTVTNPLVIDADTVLNLAVGYMADRTGAACREFVAPDVVVEGGESFDVLADDRQVQEALKWIRGELADPPPPAPPPSPPPAEPRPASAVAPARAAVSEIVMVPGMEIAATTDLGTITIVAGSGRWRTYRWNECERSVELWPRPARWYGKFGLYYPGPGDHWAECDGITRGVVDEAWWPCE
ncbi:MAG: S41 family peptidase, partial [Phycisphaerales bacterium]|nr:S41 family peptidase [Phycisphaerales bacterium]